MSFPAAEINTRPRNPRLVLLLLALLAGLSLTAGLPDGAAAKSKRMTVLGQTSQNPIPNCGVESAKRDCSVEGKVTVFQTRQSGHATSAYRVPYKKGKLVAWSISLSRPTAKQTTQYGAAQTPFFNRLFGKPAKARVAVLRRVNKKKKGAPQYKMVRQSPTQILNPYFGSTVHFTLQKPLNVIRNQLIALTIPTWAPAFWTPWACSTSPLGGLNNPAACNRAKQVNRYKASRAATRCKLGFDARTDRPNEALEKTRPHQLVNSVKRYACDYQGSRLLYTATVVAP